MLHTLCYGLSFGIQLKTPSFIIATFNLSVPEDIGSLEYKGLNRSLSKKLVRCDLLVSLLYTSLHLASSTVIFYTDRDGKYESGGNSS